jgi:transposase-like protein
MGRKRYTVEQIIRKLREGEIELGRGLTTPQMCRKIGISEQTYYRWRKRYGGMQVSQAKRLKELEQENARLKKLLAESMLDQEILKEAASGNY